MSCLVPVLALHPNWHKLHPQRARKKTPRCPLQGMSQDHGTKDILRVEAPNAHHIGEPQLLISQAETPEKEDEAAK